MSEPRDPGSGRGIVGALSRAVESSAGDDPRPVNFVRGLALGALVGAAIAGSALWSRRRHPQREPAGPPSASKVED